MSPRAKRRPTFVRYNWPSNAYARCDECDWNGPDRERLPDALDDGEAHEAEEHPE